MADSTMVFIALPNGRSTQVVQHPLIDFDDIQPNLPREKIQGILFLQ